MIIKVCGMRERDNIYEIAKLKPNWLGFIFYPKSKRYVGEKFDQAVIKSINPDIKTVGVFVNEDYNRLIEHSEKYSLAILQLHGNETPDYCQAVREKGYKVLKAFGIHNDFDMNTLKSYTDTCDFFLFDTITMNYGGSGQKFNWEILSKYHLNKPFLLSGGITPQDAEKIKQINYPNFAGIDINSGFEIEPGLKNSEHLARFFHEIRTTKI